MISAMRTPDDARWYRLALGALVLSAWAALAVWGVSPFAGLLSHRENGEGTLPLLPRLAIFVAGWTLMTIAMMLPSSLPLINLFRRIVAGRADHAQLMLRLLAGYLAVWASFGVLAYLGDAALHGAVERLPNAAAASSVIGSALLLLAGLYQFTPLKRACLTQCRSPYSFVVEHWRGRHAARDAARLGVRHGLFCVGCCWTLMLLMFAVGGANLGWMLALGAVMGAERATRWGRRLSAPLGIALIAWAALVLTRWVPFPGA
jgi:predicted metal-binding membrane protein